MNTRTAIFFTQPLPTPPRVPSRTRLLLMQTNSVTRPADLDILMPEMLTVRATQITVLLHDMIEEKGYRHAGINE